MDTELGVAIRWMSVENPGMGECHRMKKYVAAPTTALALGRFFTTTIPIAVDAIINTAASLVSPTIGNLSFTSAAMGQPDVLTKNNRTRSTCTTRQ